MNRMKKLTLIIMGVLLISVSSCSKDNEEPEIIPTPPVQEPTKDNPIEITEPVIAMINGLEYTLYPDHTAQLNKQTHELDLKVTIPPYTCFQGINYEVIRIVSNALDGHNEVESLEINAISPEIGGSPFSNMMSLKKVKYNCVEPNGEYDYVVLWQSNTFKGSDNIESIEIGPDARILINHFFQGTKNVTDVTIPGSVVTVQNNFFAAMPDLKSITIQDGVKEINYGLAISCKSLETVNYNCANCIIPYNFLVNTYVPFGYDTPNLLNLNIGDKVESIPANMFDQVTTFKVIRVLAKTPPTCDQTRNFDAVVKQNATLYVPSSTLQAYKSHNVWGQFVNIVGN